jgi:hypothetical protein
LLLFTASHDRFHLRNAAIAEQARLKIATMTTKQEDDDFADLIACTFVYHY